MGALDAKRAWCVLATIVALIAWPLGSHAALADDAAKAMPFSDHDIAEGFALTVFGREDRTPVPDGRQYVNRFVSPVRVQIINRSSTDYSAVARRFVGQLNKVVPRLRIALAAPGSRANLTAYLVDQKDYRSMIAATIGRPDKARFMQDNQCSAIMWTRTTGVIDRATIFIVADRGYRLFRGCLAEELTQSLGPANDNDRLTYSLYNDSNKVDQFGLFDWFILSTLYDSRILPGMTESEASAALPGIIADLRSRSAGLALPPE